MVTELMRAATLSALGETVAICRYEGEVIAFVNGMPLPYRIFMPLLMARMFSQARGLTDIRQEEIGRETGRLINKMNDLGVCDLRELVTLTVMPTETKRKFKFKKREMATQATQTPGYRLCFLMEMIIDNVLTKAREHAPSAGDALEYLISNIEEQYEGAVIR